MKSLLCRLSGSSRLGAVRSMYKDIKGLNQSIQVRAYKLLELENDWNDIRFIMLGGRLNTGQEINSPELFSINSDHMDLLASSLNHTLYILRP